jgi:hypothetical protein
LTLSFTVRITIPGEVLFRQPGDESVLLNLNSTSYFGLDAIGTQMWLALTSSDSLQAAFDFLLTQYDVAPRQLKQDLRELVEKLAEQGLIEVHDATGG